LTFLHTNIAVGYLGHMRRSALVLPFIALGIGATAIAQGGPPRQGQEPDVRPRAVFTMPSACRPGEKVRVRVDPPAGVTLASVRVHVGGLETVRLTGVDSPASVTVRIDGKETRVSASADTLGGQPLYMTRVYGRCPVYRPPTGQPIVGGGED
jgi:hypothetical protein